MSSISYDEIYDPLEPINRAVLNFNFFIDDIAIRPIVKTYKFIAPEPVEKGVSNFYLSPGNYTAIFMFLVAFSFFDTGKFAIDCTKTYKARVKNIYLQKNIIFDNVFSNVNRVQMSEATQSDFVF